MLTVWLCNGLYTLLLMLLSPWILYRRFTTNRYRVGLSQKLRGLKPSECNVLSPRNAPSISASASSASASERQLVWLHGVSVGEVQLLLPLIAALKAKLPNAAFALSTTTESGMEVAQRAAPDDVQLFFFPLDFSWAIRRTLKTLQPAILITGELELWPNLSRICQSFGIPMAVVNGRLSENSFRGYRRLTWLTRPMFSRLQWVGSQSESYAQRFRECGTAIDRVVTTGSLKFDNVNLSRELDEIRRLGRLVGISNQNADAVAEQDGYRIWVVGSTQPQEERLACRAFLAARKRYPKLRMIVIPRHPDRFEAVALELEEELQQRTAIRPALRLAFRN